MAQQTINVGASPNDGTGTPLRTAFQYTNSNFTELYTAVGPSGNNIVVPGSATISGDLTVDTSTLKVDSANNRVGIGTATPTVPLDVVGIGGAIFNRGSANQYRLQIGNSNKRYGLYVDLNANNTDYFAIYDDTAIQQMLTYVPGASGSWTHYINGSTAMTLNSTGLGVGVSPTQPLTVRSSAAAIGMFHSTNVNGPYVIFQNSTANFGDIGSELAITGGGSAGNLTVNSRSTSNLCFAVSDSVKMRIDSSGNVGIGVTPAGTGGCLQLKSGITFPATQVASSDANTLDDYEEGTFTPTLTFGGASVGVVYVNRIGIYTKVGRIVHFSGRIDLSSKGSSTGDALITGLPFIGNTGAASVGYQNLTAPSDKQLMLTIDGTVLFPRYASGTTTVQSTDSDFGNSTIIIFAGTFAV